MKILVGSLNPVKIAAVKDAVSLSPYFTEKETEVIGHSSDSGVSDMPTSMEEVIQGGKNRAQFLKEKYPENDFFVGLEGGVTHIGEKTFLFGCTYVISQSGEEHYGLSNFIEVPDFFVRGIFEEGKELSELADSASGLTDVRSKGGSFALWTDEVMQRKDEFEKAFHCAISPFFNSFYKI